MKVSSVKKEEGFSLIEVVIAVSIFAVGILALASLQIASVGSNFAMRKHTVASGLASGQVEELLATPYALLTNGISVVDDNYTLFWTVDPEVSGSYREVHVSVRWHDKGEERRLTFDFIRSKDIGA